MTLLWMLGAVRATNYYCPHELTDALQLNTGSPAVFLSVSRTDRVRVCFLTDQFIDRPIMRTRARVGVAPPQRDRARLEVGGSYLCHGAAALPYIC